MILQPNTITPTIVQIVAPPTEDVSVADVIVDALSLTGVIAAVAILVGLAFGVALIYAKRRHEDRSGNRNAQLNLSSH